jgi:hypothetical protein
VANEGRVGRFAFTPLPIFKIFHGRYVAELPPSNGVVPPTAVHAGTLRSSTWLTMGASKAAATKIRPFGKT